MKAKKFKEEVEELGFNLIEIGNCYYAKNNSLKTVFDLGKKVSFALNTAYYDFHKLTKDNPEKAKKLYDLCVEFARTPVDERGEVEDEDYRMLRSWLTENANALR